MVCVFKVFSCMHPSRRIATANMPTFKTHSYCNPTRSFHFTLFTSLWSGGNIILVYAVKVFTFLFHKDKKIVLNLKLIFFAEGNLVRAARIKSKSKRQ